MRETSQYPRFAARALIFLALAVGPLAYASESLPSPPPIDPEDLIRRVVKNQKQADERLASYTYDQRETQITYGRSGRPSGTETRLFYVFSGENGGESTRELVEVNGRPATEDEKRDALAEDDKLRRKKLENRAAAEAKAPPRIAGDEDDPLVGARRLSDLIRKYEYRIAGEEVIGGRPAYILEFSPRSGLTASGLGERALNSLAGRAVIDASDFQIREVEARLTKPLKVVGGLAANVNDASISFEGGRLSSERWLPCRIELRLKGKKALFLRLDQSYRFEFSNFRTFEVEAESSGVALEETSRKLEPTDPRGEER